MIEDLLLTLEASPLGIAMRTSLWLYPAANTAHLLAAATAFGAMLLADLRILGLAGGTLPAKPLFDLSIRLAIAAAALALVTGFMLFAADPLVVAASPFFIAKLLLLTALAANTLLFHLRRSRDLPSTTAAATSLLAWTGVLVCGRLIAYW